MRRRYCWRTWAACGGLSLDQRFATPAEAGVWRRENFPATVGPGSAPLTFMAVVDDQLVLPSALELFDAQAAWLWETA